MNRFQRSALLLPILLALGGAAFPQASSSSLQGTVTDPTGSAIPGATVRLSDNGSKTQRTTVTGPQGEYRFFALPPGTYSLSVNATGFAHYVQTDLQLLVNTPTTANTQLRVGSAAESVTVSSEAPALNAVDASLGNSFGENQVKQVPIEARNVPELLSLQAGVTYTGHRLDLQDASYKDQDTRSGAVNGARSDQSNITLDGVDVNDQSNGYAFTSVLPTTVDSMQEFRVTTSNYNADQGTGSGAQVALVTKSGTNQFHGSLYEYLRNTVTSANDYFVKAAEVRLGQPNKPDKLNYNIFGVSVGGPLRKDRLFFFANYEGTRQRQELSTIRAIPTSSFTPGAQTLCNGFIRYADANGGTTVIPPTGAQSLQTLDPLGLGINPAVLDLTNRQGYFDKTFCNGKFLTNDPSVGDGLNYSGFRFRAPTRLDNNAFIARLDYHITANGKHTLFWRGSLHNLYSPQAPFLPGAPPAQTVTDHSKGFVVGYTSLLSSNIVNILHYGFTRQSTGFLGNAQQEWNVFYGLDQGINYTHNAQTPLHNLLDDFSWTRGSHSLQFGASVGFARNPRLSYQHSFALGKGATNWMSPTGFSNTGGGYLDPANQGFAEPASSFAYDYPVLALLGMVSDEVANYNYDKQGNVLPSGAPVKRNYGLNWYELYGQDSWRVKPNLTLTYGVRWSMFPPPWEIDGYQASPTVNLGSQFDQIAKQMKQGMGYDFVPLVAFQLGGAANHAPGLYNFEKSDFSPRFSIAYSPRPHASWLKTLMGEGDKTVFRGGFSKVYDRPGMELLNTFDANPPGGLGATIQNPCCLFGYDDAAHVPRISNINSVPTYGCAPSAPGTCGNPTNQRFLLSAPPALHPLPAGQAITWGIDQSLKTPHAYAFDFSIGRELPNRLSLQVAYVGRLGRNLLTQRDLRQPLNIVDPISKVDYYSAATALAKVALAHPNSSFVTYNDYVNFVSSSINDAAIGPTAAYWHDMLPPLQPGATQYQSFRNFAGITPAAGNASLIQAVYDLYYDPFLSYVGNEVVGIGDIDLYGGINDDAGNFYYFCPRPGCKNLTGGQPGDFLNNQATSMFAWSSVGRSKYDALQVNLKKQFSSGAQFDLNYTYSKSTDITSAATRLSWSSSTNIGAPGTRLANAFDPNSRRAVSDFDTTHQINANWIVELPFGKGRRFANHAAGVTDALVGGWQLSGVARWTSGFPFTIDNGNYWPTNWDEQGIAQMISKPQTGHFRQPNGTVSVFANSAAARAKFQHPFPGQAGSRNVVRGDGYAGWDLALSKRWRLPIESHSVQFRWEVFNVPNLHRFNVLSGLGNAACGCIASLQQVPERFGAYTGLLTDPRVMQFALRYEF